MLELVLVLGGVGKAHMSQKPDEKEPGGLERRRQTLPHPHTHRRRVEST